MGFPRILKALIATCLLSLLGLWISRVEANYGDLGVSISTSVSPVKVDEPWRREKQDSITFATRAPNSKDKGMLWIEYTENSDTTMTLYIRHPKSGTWRHVHAT